MILPGGLGKGMLFQHGMWTCDALMMWPAHRAVCTYAGYHDIHVTPSRKRDGMGGGGAGQLSD